MKKIIITICLLFFTFTGYCEKLQENEILSDVNNSIPKDLYVIDYAFGNFLSVNELSLMILCDKKININASKNVSNIYFFEVKKNKPVFWGELKAECCYFNYDDDVNTAYASVGMNQDLSSLGKAYRFGWLGDFNDNGITELMFVQSAYSEEGATLEFWEFKNGKFNITLKGQDAITYILEADKKNHQMKLERSKYSSSMNDYVSTVSTILWNEKDFKYVEK